MIKIKIIYRNNNMLYISIWYTLFVYVSRWFKVYYTTERVLNFNIDDIYCLFVFFVYIFAENFGILKLVSYMSFFTKNNIFS